MILLACLSTVLLVFILTVSFQLFKYWVRTRKYIKIRHQPNQQYISRKNEADRENENYSFLPVTRLISVQSGTPPVQPSFKPISLANSVGSNASSTFARKTNINHAHLNRAFNMDDRALKGSFRTRRMERSSDAPLSHRSFESPPPQMNSYMGSINSRASSRNSIGEGYTVYSAENTPDRFLLGANSAIYSHSNLLPDAEDSNFNLEPVVSYDQESNPTENRSTQYGLLSFILEYHAQIPELLITVKHAIDLPSCTGSSDGQVNSYVNLCIVPEDFLWKRTQVVENNRDPCYNETFQIQDVLYHKLREYTICFYVMDVHPTMGERVIGKVLYPLCELRAEQIVDTTRELSSP